MLRKRSGSIDPSAVERIKLANTAFIHESVQNWQHHRHLESQRNQYLGFFFTALLASVGLLAALAGKQDFDPQVLIAVGSVLSFVLNAISFGIYAAVCKIGAVLRFYDAEIALLRRRMFKDLTVEAEGYGSRALAGLHMPPLMRTKIYSVQGMAETILAGTSAGLLVTQLAITAFAVWRFRPDMVSLWITATLSAISIVLLLRFLVFRNRVSRMKAGGGD